LGAIELAGTWRTTAQPDDVWAVVVDLATWSQWWPAIDDVDLREGDVTAPEAARLTFGTPPPLRPLRVDIEVRELEAPRWMVVEAPDSAITGHGRLAIEPDGGGAATRFEVSLHVRSLLFRPLERILASATRSSGKDRLRQAGDDLARLAGGEPRDHDV
jgi:uncharacterized protein YndB with AHSA1/START domain